MNVVKCAEGHFFDSDKYDRCPHCGAGLKYDSFSRAEMIRKTEASPLTKQGTFAPLPDIEDLFGDIDGGKKTEPEAEAPEASGDDFDWNDLFSTLETDPDNGSAEAVKPEEKLPTDAPKEDLPDPEAEEILPEEAAPTEAAAETAAQMPETGEGPEIEEIPPEEAAEKMPEPEAETVSAEEDIFMEVVSDSMAAEEEDDDDGPSSIESIIAELVRNNPSPARRVEQLQEAASEEPQKEVSKLPENVQQPKENAPEQVEAALEEQADILDTDLFAPEAAKASGNAKPVVREALAYSEEDPVCGWLACIGGPHLGATFPVFAGENSIGRSGSNQIVLDRDQSVSREQAVISYMPSGRSFYLMPGQSKNLTYVNGRFVLEPVQLKEHAVIEMGGSKFLFAPLCGPDFSWEDYIGGR